MSADNAMTGAEAIANGDEGPPKGRELEIADLLRFNRDAGIANTVWLTADVHYTSANYYNPDKAKFQDFTPFWEFVSGPIHDCTKRRTGDERILACRELADIDNIEAVDVLCWIEGIQNLHRRNLLGQRQLHQYAMNGGIPVEVVDERQQLGFRGFGAELVLPCPSGARRPACQVRRASVQGITCYRRRAQDSAQSSTR